MPSANDKVVLAIKLETKGILTDLKKVKREVLEIKGTGEKREKVERTNRKKTSSEERAFHKERIKRGLELLRLKEREERTNKKSTVEAKKQHVLLRDMGGIQKRMQDRVAAFAKKHPWLAQGGRLVSKPVGLAARGVGAVARGGAAVGSAALGMLISSIQQNFGTYLQVGAAKGGLTGMGGTYKQYQAALRGTGRGGLALGYGPAETFQQAAGVGRATGNTAAVYRAQQLARAGGGMDVGEATGIMGQLRQGGIEFGNKDIGKGGKGTKVLERLIAAGMATGIERARLPEYLQGIGGLIEQQGGRQAGTVDAGAMASSLNWIMGVSGMTGRRGVQLANQMQQMITAPGGGEAGQAMVLQSMGFGKPGGNTPYYEALKQQEKGIADPRNMKNLLKEVYTQYGQVGAGGKSPMNQEANLVLKEMSGINLSIWEEIGDMVKSGKSQEEIDKKIKELMAESGPIDQQALDQTKKGFTDVVKYLKGTEAWQANMGGKFAPEVIELEKLQRRVTEELANFVKKYLPDIKDALVAVKDATVGAFNIAKETFELVYKKEPSAVALETAKEEKVRRENPSIPRSNIMPLVAEESKLKRLEDPGGIWGRPQRQKENAAEIERTKLRIKVLRNIDPTFMTPEQREEVKLQKMTPEEREEFLAAKRSMAEKRQLTKIAQSSARAIATGVVPGVGGTNVPDPGEGTPPPDTAGAKVKRWKVLAVEDPQRSGVKPVDRTMKHPGRSE